MGPHGDAEYMAWWGWFWTGPHTTENRGVAVRISPLPFKRSAGPAPIPGWLSGPAQTLRLLLLEDLQKRRDRTLA
jgi:hypothetical protein